MLPLMNPYFKVRIHVFDGHEKVVIQDRFTKSELSAFQHAVDELTQLPYWVTYTYYYRSEWIELADAEDPYIECIDLGGAPRTFPSRFEQDFLNRRILLKQTDSEPIYIRLEAEEAS